MRRYSKTNEIRWIRDLEVYLSLKVPTHTIGKPIVALIGRQIIIIRGQERRTDQLVSTDRANLTDI